MPEPFEIARTRGLQTNSVWDTYNNAFKVGKLTLPLHIADVDLLTTQAALRDTAKDMFDLAEEPRSDNLELLADLNVRVPHVIESNLEADSGLHNQFGEIYAIQGLGQDDVQKRAVKVVSLWQLYNTERAAQAPPLAALDVGGTLVATMSAALTAHPGLIKTAQDKKALWTKAKSTLRLTTDKVDANNKRWYEAWKMNYPAGTPERDALNNIDTEGGGALPVEKAVIDMGNALPNQNVDIHYHADHATAYNIYYRLAGTTDWTLINSGVGGVTWSGTMPAPGNWEFSVIGSNSFNEGERSDPFALTVA